MGPSLLDLPAEIRLMIYDYALPDRSEPRVVHHPPPLKFCYERAGDPWALYRTCRLIRDELPPIDSKGITLVLHMLPWQGPAEVLLGSRTLAQDRKHPETLWNKFLRMAPHVEKLRLSGPRLCAPGQFQQHRDQLHRLLKKAHMPRLEAVEVQPQQWGMNDWSLAFQLVKNVGLGKRNVQFLDKYGQTKKPPSDLHRLPEWAQLRNNVSKARM